MSKRQPPVVLLMGPTASGKTDLAIELVRRLPCDIVSVDSAMIYREMDIGTAKPGADILAEAPHRLIDILDPSESYSAGQFLKDATREIDAITTRDRIPLLAGGTMMYFRVLQQGIAELPEADPGVREEIDGRALELGWPAVHAELEEIDPVTASRISPNDSQRIQRALEVYLVSGTPISSLQNSSSQRPPDVRFVKVGLMPESRDELHDRINRRLDDMIEQGFVDEVRALHAREDLDPDKPSMRCVGYRQLWKYFDGDCDLADAIEKAATATRQLAKRQLTWLRAERDTYLVDSFKSGKRKEIPDILQRSLRIEGYA